MNDQHVPGTFQNQSNKKNNASLFEHITLSSDYCESSLGRELPLFV
ncbi:hypothetical protein [Bacillus pseudomycoides]|nr:hypothetical protein [Bacillus pseudomycoides]